MPPKKRGAAAPPADGHHSHQDLCHVLGLAAVHSGDPGLVAGVLCCCKQAAASVLAHGSQRVGLVLDPDDPHRVHQQALWVKKHGALVGSIDVPRAKDPDAEAAPERAILVHLALSTPALRLTYLQIDCEGVGWPVGLNTDSLETVAAPWEAFCDIRNPSAALANLKELFLYHAQLPGLVSKIAGLRSLRSLGLSNPEGGQSDLQGLSQLTHLEDLQLLSNPCDAAQALAWPHLPALKHLYVRTPGWPAEPIARGIAAATRLTCLDLVVGGSSIRTDLDAIRNLDRFRTLLQPLSQLRRLTLAIKDDLPPLGRLAPSLTMLRLRCRTISVAAVVDVCGLSHLKTLWLNTRLPSDVIVALASARLEGLQRLTVCDTASHPPFAAADTWAQLLAHDPASLPLLEALVFAWRDAGAPPPADWLAAARRLQDVCGAARPRLQVIIEEEPPSYQWA